MASEKSQENTETKAKPRGKNQRKLRNPILNAEVQLAFAVNIICLTIFFSVSIGLIIYFQLGDFLQEVLTSADFSDAQLATYQSDWNATLQWIGFFMGAYVVTTVVLCVLYTHKMIGPSVAFIRHIRSLKHGQYKSRVNLRDGDAFADVAMELNDLAVILEKSQENRNKVSKSA